ncbi:DUF4270 domain-containing protein [uncultured Nonlabens sp.]|uniref:DUF4270 domain-containing protein n=1 Tax=uncultured Nonlabens sp. TaxID=859306 RepID=UPI002604BA1D|nr:DUF4270 domain-containing protein [uncultured Nonlabens sp.]
MKKMLCSAAVAIAVVLGVVSCDNDLTPLGANFLGEDASDVIQEAVFDLKTYSVPVHPVQTNNFTSFPLGTYNDPVYGRTTYGIVSQVNLANSNVDFSGNAVLKDVYLDVPYYSRAISIQDEATTYQLDSIYGNQSVDLKIYRNGYFLSSFSGEDVTQGAVYYSDLDQIIDSNKGELIYRDETFIPVNAEELITEIGDEGVSEVVERLAPRLRVGLTMDQWKELLFQLDTDGSIIDSRPELSSASNFQNYFRGLYFKIEAANGDGNMIHLDLNAASITYVVEADTGLIDENDSDGDGDVTDAIRVVSEYRINFNGNKAVLIDNDFSPTVQADIAASSDPINGAENLYLKGGPGSLAVIELFGQATNDVDGEAPELTQIIENDWLINEASIEFHVNQSIVEGGESEPERILIYDYDDNTILADFVFGTSSAAIAPVNANTNHLGRLERVVEDDLDSDGTSYKIRITQHLNNIIQGTIENNRLAIVTSQNVTLLGNTGVQDTPVNNSDLEMIPLGAAISHEGTVIYGNLSPEVDKRPVLKVYYSETTN